MAETRDTRIWVKDMLNETGDASGKTEASQQLILSASFIPVAFDVLHEVSSYDPDTGETTVTEENVTYDDFIIYAKSFIKTTKESIEDVYDEYYQTN